MTEAFGMNAQTLNSTGMTSPNVNSPNMNSPNMNSTNMNNAPMDAKTMSPHGSLPEPDSVKMFVGQIPKTMDEEHLRPMFEEYGPVYHLNVLRKNNEHKGCCFVTYYTGKDAEKAKKELHNSTHLPGMKHPIQMKPADHEKNADERKLFVGMLNKNFSEDDVRVMFAPYGTIEQCTVLRDADACSKGCSFVQFTHKYMAQNAIKELHHSTIMEGCSSKLVVKIADTIKEKEQKRQTQIQQQLFQQFLNGLGPQCMTTAGQSGGGGGGIGGMGIGGGGGGGVNNSGNMPNLNTIQQLSNLQGINMPQLAALLAMSQQGNNAQTANPLVANPLANNPLASNPSVLSAQNTSLMGLSGGTTVPQARTLLPGNPAQANPGGLQGFAGMTGTNNIGTTPGVMGNNTKAPDFDLNALSQAYAGIQQYAEFLKTDGFNQSSTPNFKSDAAFHNGFGMFGTNQQGQPHNKQTEGPEGSNLFIYHLPPEFGDLDLIQSFAAFGTILSAKVFIDRKTNLSKCFGFVSYNDPRSAQAAIQAMNGFQIGTKRLKVQLKRSKDLNKPY